MVNPLPTMVDRKDQIAILGSPVENNHFFYRGLMEWYQIATWIGSVLERLRWSINNIIVFDLLLYILFFSWPALPCSFTNFPTRKNSQCPRCQNPVRSWTMIDYLKLYLAILLLHLCITPLRIPLPPPPPWYLGDPSSFGRQRAAPY